MLELAFTTPWALLALGILPALWWLLRLTPPAPHTVRFPAIRLLLGLESHQDTAARTPWWMLVLRLLLVIVLILGVAGPLITPVGERAAKGSPLVLVIDTGWAAARDWAARQAAAMGALDQAERDERSILLLTTAAGAEIATQPLSVASARALVRGLEPKPWPTLRRPVAEAIRALPRDQVLSAVWLSDGLDEDGSGVELAKALQHLGGGVEILLGRTGRVLTFAAPNGWEIEARRASGLETAETAVLQAVDEVGHVLGQGEATFPAGTSSTTAKITLPPEMASRVTRLGLANEQGAGAVLLLDESRRQRTVGLVSGSEAATPFLDGLYYVQRALTPFADLRRGLIGAVVETKPAVIILADIPAILGTSAIQLRHWMNEGGVLVRFAGPALAHAAAEQRTALDGEEGDPFLPVRLRAGQRTLGGALSWSSPKGVAPFEESSPFAGLTVPSEVNVSAQVLAEPNVLLPEQIWARLTDGTPLVTAKRQGKGWVVLVHTTANTAWSNLALSSLFVEMLQRILTLPERSDTAHAASSEVLAPLKMLDGFGRLGAVSETVVPGEQTFGPHHPPGLYGTKGQSVAVNLGPHLKRLTPLQPPQGVRVAGLDRKVRESDLRPPLLMIALALIGLDLLLTLVLRRGGRTTVVAGTLLLVLVVPAQAAQDLGVSAGLFTRLAYVITGDAGLDQTSAVGLESLSEVIGQRSTAVLAKPMGVDLERDSILFFPLLYWPLSPHQQALSPESAEKLNVYMRMGGVVVLDTAALPFGSEHKIPEILEGVALPPLIPLDTKHVLTRSFFLLKETPGRVVGDTVWVAEQAESLNDGVSPVVIGNQDWAGAWAVDQRGRSLYPVLPGGDQQREAAFRFGVNVVMYALTGNYKADQVHLPAILERLGR